LVQLSNGSNQLATGASTLAAGTKKLQTGAGELASKLKEGSAQVPSWTPNNALPSHTLWRRRLRSTW
jgi:putative membrane protein